MISYSVIIMMIVVGVKTLVPCHDLSYPLPYVLNQKMRIEFYRPDFVAPIRTYANTQKMGAKVLCSRLFFCVFVAPKPGFFTILGRKNSLRL